MVACSSVDNSINSEKEITYLLLRGINFSQSQNYIEAERELSKVIVLDSDNIYALRELAFVQSKLGKNIEAAKSYETILKIDPKDINAIKGYATLLYNGGNFYEALDYITLIPNIYNNPEIAKIKTYLSILEKKFCV